MGLRTRLAGHLLLIEQTCGKRVGAAQLVELEAGCVWGGCGVVGGSWQQEGALPGFSTAASQPARLPRCCPVLRLAYRAATSCGKW
jgi:hypothetical protein